MKVLYLREQRPSPADPVTFDLQAIGQQMDLLREDGIESKIVTLPTDFDSLLRRDFGRHRLACDDVVVVPGRWASQREVIPGERHVLFVHDRPESLADHADLRDRRLIGIWCVSRGDADVVRSMNPACPVYVVQPNAMTAQREALREAIAEIRYTFD